MHHSCETKNNNQSAYKCCNVPKISLACYSFII